jgi:hypothetical protein
VLYLTAFQGSFEISFIDCTTGYFELLLGVLFYFTERLDWVEERGCSRVFDWGYRIVLGEILIEYICIYLFHTF